MKKGIFSVLLLALFWVACSDDTTAPPQRHNQLVGTVTDIAGNPVADAGILMVYERPDPLARPNTPIAFDLPESTQVLLAVLSDAYEDTVRTLQDGLLPPGQHAISWDGLDSEGLIVPSGVYYYLLFMGEDVSDAAIAVQHDDYPLDADPAAYHFLTRTDAEGHFVLEQGPRNFDYPFYQHDEQGNVIGSWSMSRTVRFYAMAEGFSTGRTEWAHADPDSGCAVNIELSTTPR